MSMPKRLDAMFGKENNGKTWWNKIGVAFLNKNENGYNVVLDSMPASIDGAYKFQLFEPNENNSGNGSGSAASKRPQANIPEESDNIPF